MPENLRRFDINATSPDFYVQMLIYRFDIVSIEGSRYLYADIYTRVTTRYQHIIFIQDHLDI